MKEYLIKIPMLVRVVGESLYDENPKNEVSLLSRTQPDQFLWINLPSWWLLLLLGFHKFSQENERLLNIYRTWWKTFDSRKNFHFVGEHRCCLNVVADRGVFLIESHSFVSMNKIPRKTCFWNIFPWQKTTRSPLLWQTFICMRRPLEKIFLWHLRNLRRQRRVLLRSAYCTACVWKKEWCILAAFVLITQKSLIQSTRLKFQFCR